MSLESGKNLGGIGALLLVIGTFVPFLSIVGIILLLVGIKNLADYYGSNDIFQDSLYACIFGIIGIASIGIVLISFLFGAASIGASSGTAFFGLAVAAIIALVVAFVFYVLMAVYFRKSFDLLATKTGEGMFGTAGTLLLIGAILTIIFVGLILIFIAWILLTVAFFSIKATTAPKQPPPPPVPP